MKTIDNKEDIKILVDSFYNKVRKDELLHPVFDTVISDTWDKHLAKMYQFWETILFDTVGYKGSPVRKHMELDDQYALDKKLFDRWTSLWEATIDQLFTGVRAQEAKKRAQYMAMLMNYKIEHKRS